MGAASSVDGAEPAQARDSAARDEVDRLNHRAHAIRHQDASAALVLVRQARAMAEGMAYTAGQARSMLREGLLRYMLGEVPQAYEPLLGDSLVLLRASGDQAGEAEAFNLRGVILATRGEHDEAIQQHRHALALRRNLGDLDGEALSLNNLGLSLRQSARPAEALEVLLQSLDVAHRSGADVAVAYAQLNIGATLADLGDPAGAAERFADVLRRIAGNSDQGIACSAHIHLGKAYLTMGQHELALASLHRAWTLAEQTGNAGDQAEALCALGSVHQALGAFSTAEERLHAALGIARRRAQPALVADVLRLLGRNELLQRRPHDALLLLDEALRMALGRGALQLAARIHELLAQAHEAAGDLAEALVNLREFHRHHDALQGQATLRRVHALLWQHQVTGLQREAQTQRDLNESLAHALAAARQAEQEKAVLLAEVAAQAQALQQLAREDGLTGVANRRWFDTQWPKELERARRHQHALAVAMIDVDDFKSINDRFGHPLGDEVLRRVARLLRENCRSNDLVARYGGEEFVLMFVETGLEGARATCEKLRGLVQAMDWTPLHAELGSVTVSIGVACWTHALAPRNVLGDADAQLYRAKRAGKNRVFAEAAEG